MKRFAVVVTVLVVVSAALAGLRAMRDAGGPLTDALSYAPSDAARFTFTDWSEVRDELDTEVDASATRDEVATFLDEGYDADLTSMSTLADVGGLLQQGFGFSPASLDWELYTQSDKGAVDIARLPDEIDTDDVASHLRELGYTEPTGDDHVWTGDQQLVAGIDPEAPAMPALQHIALDPSRRLVVLGDQADYVEKTMTSITGSTPGALPEGLRSSARALDEPLSALVTTGDYACSELGFADLDDTDQQQLDQLVNEAGKINPLQGFAIGAVADGVRVAMAFESDDQARVNADTRAKLAAGPAPGQGGTFPERFDLGDVVADDAVVTMTLRPHDEYGLFSDLSNGAVAFATC